MFKVLGVLLLTIIFTCTILILSKQVQPTSSMYPFRRAYEKLIFLTKRTPQEKIHYYYYLLNEREKEIETTFHSTNAFAMLSSTLRYSSTAGKLTNTIITSQQIQEKSPTLKLFQNNTKKLQILRSHYSGNEGKFIEDGIHYLGLYTKQLEDLK